jgi:hypothetical protein
MSTLALDIQAVYPRQRRVAQAIAALWILAVADLAFTIWAHIFTPFIELNPVASAMLRIGFPALVAFKFTVTMIGTVIFWRLRGHGRAELMLWGLVLVYVLLAMRWSEYTHGAVASISL